MIKITGRENVGHHYRNVQKAMKKFKSSASIGDINTSGRENRGSFMEKSSSAKKITKGKTEDVSGLMNSGSALNYKNMADAISKEQVASF